MAATFLQAFVGAYGAITVPSGHTALPTLFGEQIADSQVSYPRAEFQHGGEIPTFNSDGVVRKIDAHLDVWIYDTGLASAEQLGQDATDGLTVSSLTITGKRNRLWPPIKHVSIAQERTTDQRPVFAVVLKYHCEISV